MTAYDFDWDDESGYDLYDEPHEEPRRRTPLALLVGIGVVVALAGVVGGSLWVVMGPGAHPGPQLAGPPAPAGPPPVVLRTHSGTRPGTDGGIPSAGTLVQGDNWMFAPGVVTGARGFASSAEAPSTNVITSNAIPAPLPPANPGRQANGVVPPGGVAAPLPTPNPLSRERDTYADLAQRDAEKDHLPWEKVDVPLPTPGSGYALYDIVGQTVYLPNGERLEAHSGYGKMFDDPRHISKRMVGPTPPNTYNLVMRESLFHGVEAIRMNPVDRDKMFGRDGILTHTYLLGPRGDSNGCVSFRNYEKFLAAFKRGEVKQMIVVAELANPPPPANPRLAWLSGSKR